MSEQTQTLDRRAAAGAVWTLAGFGGAQLLRLAGNLLLTRLLFPEAFGLMAIVTVVLVGLELFSDLGFRPSVVQNERGDDPDFLNTAWTLQIVRGFALGGVCLAMAYPLGAFYGEPSLPPLLMMASLSVIANGFGSMSLFTAARHMRLRPLTLLEVGTQGAALLVMAVWGLIWPSVWALLAGHVTWNVLRSALSHVMLPGHPARLHWELGAARELFHFGKWIFVSTALTFLANEGDRLLFAKLVPLELLGIYSVAVMLSGVPTVAMGRLIMDVLFPAYSRVHLTGGDVKATVERYRGPLITLTGCGCTAIVVCGPDLVSFMYDDRYLAAGWMLQLMAISIWFRVLEQANSALLLSIGEPNWVAAGHGAMVGGVATLVPTAFFLFGFPAAVGAYALAEVCRYVVSALAIRRHGFAALRDVIPSVMVAGGSGLGLLGLSLLPGMTFDLTRVAVGAALALALWSPFLLRAGLRLRTAVAA